jgi:hypothetical protein
MPLTLDDRGLLPPGIHDATLPEIEASFARFQRSDRRIKLFEKLKAYLAELGRTGWKCEVILDGSFVGPTVDEPNDIDLILVLASDWDRAQELRPFEYNLLSKRFARQEYGIDVSPVAAGSKSDVDVRRFFEQYARNGAGSLDGLRVRQRAW